MPINFGPVPTIIRDAKLSKSFVCLDLFGDDSVRAVNFFYKLPEKVRLEFESLYSIILPIKDRLVLERDLDFCETYLKGLTLETYDHIMHTADDYTYFKFHDVYQILQPTIETIINANDLYNEYPECLI